MSPYAYPAPWLYGVYGFGKNFADSFFRMRHLMLQKQQQDVTNRQKERALDIQQKAVDRYTEYSKNYERNALVNLLKTVSDDPKAFNAIMNSPHAKELLGDLGSPVLSANDPVSAGQQLYANLMNSGNFDEPTAKWLALTVMSGGKTPPKELLGAIGVGGKGGGGDGGDGATIMNFDAEGNPQIYDAQSGTYRSVTPKDLATMPKKSKIIFGKGQGPAGKTYKPTDYNYDQNQDFESLKKSFESEGATPENINKLQQFNISAGPPTGMYAAPVKGEPQEPGWFSKALGYLPGQKTPQAQPGITLKKVRPTLGGSQVAPYASSTVVQPGPNKIMQLPPGTKQEDMEEVGQW